PCYHPPPVPRPTIGFWTAVTLVLGNMIGSGVFLLPASLAPYGGLALAGWLLSAAGSVLLALVFARLARLNPAAGGIYAYTREAFVTTALKILPLIVIGIAGIVVLQPSHFPLPAGGIRAAAGGVTATATLTLWAFLGIECATIPAGAIRDPERTIPRATVTGA